MEGVRALWSTVVSVLFVACRSAPPPVAEPAPVSVAPAPAASAPRCLPGDPCPECEACTTQWGHGCTRREGKGLGLIYPVCDPGCCWTPSPNVVPQAAP